VISPSDVYFMIVLFYHKEKPGSTRTDLPNLKNPETKTGIFRQRP